MTNNTPEPKKKVIRMNRKAPAEMVCYLCGEIIDELDPHIYIGKGSDGVEMYRHADAEHEQMILNSYHKVERR